MQKRTLLLLIAALIILTPTIHATWKPISSQDQIFEKVVAGDGEAWALDEAGILFYTNTPPSWEKIPDTTPLRKIFVTKESTLWCEGTDGNVYTLNKETKTLEAVTTIPSGSFATIQSISIFDKDSIMGINNNGQVVHFTSSTTVSSTPTVPSIEDLLGDILKDAEKFEEEAEEFEEKIEEEPETTAGWKQMPGTMKQISVGNKNNIWAVNTQYKVYRWEDDAWKQVDGELRNISVASDGTAWGLNRKDQIFIRDSGSWMPVPGKLRQISVGSKDHVWGVNKKGRIYKWTGKKWQKVKGKLKHVSVNGKGVAFGVNKDMVLYRIKPGETKWTLIKSAQRIVKQISFASSDFFWGVGKDGEVYRVKNDQWVKTPAPADMSYIDIALDGTLCGIDKDGGVWRGQVAPDSLL